MSVQAIVWVLEECPDLPKHLVATMVGLANHADQNGRGSYPSQDLLAWYARKDERSIRRDLDQLADLGLIAEGDQRMVLHMPADKRPVVWDLAMGRKRPPRPDTRRPGRPKSQPDTPENRGDVDVPPPTETGNRGDVDVQIGGTPTSNRGDVDVPLTVLEPSLEPTPVRTRGHDAAAADAGQAATRGETNSLSPTDRDSLNTAVQHAAALRAGVPGWGIGQIRAAVRAALADGDRPADVAATLTRMAADPDTRAPGRLRHHTAGPAASSPPRVADGPVPYLDNARPRCRTHPGHPGDNCSPCRVDARVAAAESGGSGQVAARPLTASEARAEATRIAAAAKTRAAASHPARRRPAAKPRCGQPPADVSEDTAPAVPARHRPSQPAVGVAA